MNNCPLMGAGLKTSYEGFAILCLNEQANATCYNQYCLKCETGQDIKNSKKPKVWPEGLSFFTKKEMPRGWKPLKIETPIKVPYGVSRKRGISKYPFFKMKVNDVVEWSYDKQKSIRGMLNNLKYKNGWKFTTKKEGEMLRIKRTA